MTRDLTRLLRPDSIAVIGGGDVSKYVIENCHKIGFSGPVWHVHPTKGDFALPSDLPAAPDVAFVGVNRLATLDIMAELRDMNAGGAVAYASGFMEADQELGDGAAMQACLLEAAGDMALIGPNCYGFLNYLDGAGLWPDQQGGRRVDSGVAIITQSSNIGINLTMQKRGLPIAYLVTAGNQAQIGIAAIGAALLADPRVTALGLHIEGIGDIRALEALAEGARASGKPIVALKAGKSEQARAATLSHTASLAGSAAGSSALLSRLGIAQADTLSALLEALKLLHVTGSLASNRIASLSCSGGEASLMADLAVGRELEFPKLDDHQKTALRIALGPKVSLANPLDYHTYIWAQQAEMTQAYSAMMEGDLALGAVVSDFPRADRCSDTDWEPVIEAVTAAAKTSGKPMAIIASLPENMPETTAARLIASGVAPLNGMEEALSAIEVAAWLGQDRARAAPILLPLPAVAPKLLSEAQGKEALARFGLDVPKSQSALAIEELPEAAKTVGFPLVLKGEGIAHKTESGAVALNLSSVAEVVNNAKTMSCETFLVEEMIAGGIAELLVGVVLDPAHGYVLTIAAGGVLTEILQDSVSLLLPVQSDDIDRALDSLKIAPMLRGYRGAAPVDRAAILAAIDAVQRYVLAHHGEIDEVEVNPLICTSNRAIAADVLIRIGQKQTEQE